MSTAFSCPRARARPPGPSGRPPRHPGDRRRSARTPVVGCPPAMAVRCEGSAGGLAAPADPGPRRVRARPRGAQPSHLRRRAGRQGLRAGDPGSDLLTGGARGSGVLLDAEAVWSMWLGYFDSPSSAPALRILRRNGVALHTAHASGHACPRDLRRLVAALSPGRVVPVHTEFPHAMAELVGHAEPHRDGEWWEA